MAGAGSEGAGMRRPWTMREVFRSAPEWCCWSVIGAGLILGPALWVAAQPKGLTPAQTAVLRAEARQTACISNLRQIGSALQMYVADWDGALPPATRWRSAPQVYTRRADVWVCPAAMAPPGYAFNKRLPGLAVARIPDPAFVVTVFDANAARLGVLGDAALAPGSARHPEGNCYGVLDGSARCLQRPPSFGLKLTPRPAASPLRVRR